MLLAGLAACSTSTSSATTEPPVPTPLPTVGLDAGADRITVGADVRAVEPTAVEEIVMIGDSITIGALPALDEQFELLGFDDVTIVAQEGKRMDADSGSNTSGSDIARFVAGNVDGPPEEQLWIVALGTNDIGNTEDVDTIVAVIDNVIEPVPDDSPLIWVNTYIADRPDGTDALNAAIERVIDDRGNAMVGRWDVLASAGGVLSGDGVHPSTAGSVAFATLVTTTVADFLGR